MVFYHLISALLLAVSFYTYIQKSFAITVNSYTVFKFPLPHGVRIDNREYFQQFPESFPRITGFLAPSIKSVVQVSNYKSTEFFQCMVIVWHD